MTDLKEQCSTCNNMEVMAIGWFVILFSIGMVYIL